MLKKMTLCLAAIWCFLLFSHSLSGAEESSSKNELQKMGEELGKSPLRLEKVKQEALNGNLGFQFLLGYMYQFGAGVPQDYKQTAYWDSMAAEAGLPDSQASLGLLYYLGDGLKKDRVKAMMWLTIACAAGDKFHGRYVEWKDMVEKELAKEELARARDLAEAWIKARPAPWVYLHYPSKV